MVYCLQAELAFSTATRRDAVLADMQARIANRPRWGASTVVASEVAAGPFGIVAELRFTQKAHQEDLLSRLEAFATGARAPLAGSVIRLHDCTHDEPAHACSVTQTRTF